MTSKERTVIVDSIFTKAVGYLDTAPDPTDEDKRDKISRAEFQAALHAIVSAIVDELFGYDSLTDQPRGLVNRTPR